MERKPNKYQSDLSYEDTVVLQAISDNEGIMPDGEKVTYEQLVDAIFWYVQDLQNDYKEYIEASDADDKQYKKFLASFVLGSAHATQELINYFCEEFREKLL